jgi:hypothetical protein
MIGVSAATAPNDYRVPGSGAERAPSNNLIQRSNLLWVG